jgi:hypothetical protein
MALKPCRECKKEVSTDASACPHCGRKAPTVSTLRRLVFSGALGFIFFLVCTSTLGRSSSSRPEKVSALKVLTSGVHAQVAGDLIEQYETAKRAGSKMDACVHAGAVKMAFIQAKDEDGTRKWGTVQRKECAIAGLPTE